MVINGKIIANNILKYLKKEVIAIKKEHKLKKPKLVVFSVKPAAQDSSFIRSKERAAKQIGADFQLISYKRAPRFEDFAQELRSVASNPTVTAVIIQKPLPPSLTTVTLVDYIPIEKEIEANKKKSPFISPIGLATLSVIKHYFAPANKQVLKSVIVDIEADMPFLKQLLKRKKIVLVGSGQTGGKPIGETLTAARINYINLNSTTPQPENFLKVADIIIAATGRNVIESAHLKPGAILIGVGIRREKGEWKGDYDEPSIKNVAAAYTPTPGGVGPIDVACLMYNLVQSWKMQSQIGD